MEHQQQHHLQYEHDEHSGSLDSPYYEHSTGQSWPLDPTNSNHHQGEVGVDDGYDGEVNDYAQDTAYDDELGDQNADYEPPSPSYPYPEDQQPPESDIPAEDLDDQENYESEQESRHIRRSEIYEHDAVSGHLAERDSSIISEYLKSKDPDWENADQQRTEPLTLLDLPVDILRLIVKEASQTHTLASHPVPCLPM